MLNVNPLAHPFDGFYILHIWHVNCVNFPKGFGIFLLQERPYCFCHNITFKCHVLRNLVLVYIQFVVYTLNNSHIQKFDFFFNPAVLFFQFFPLLVVVQKSVEWVSVGWNISAFCTKAFTIFFNYFGFLFQKFTAKLHFFKVVFSTHEFCVPFVKQVKIFVKSWKCLSFERFAVFCFFTLYLLFVTWINVFFFLFFLQF